LYICIRISHKPFVIIFPKAHFYPYAVRIRQGRTWMGPRVGELSGPWTLLQQLGPPCVVRQWRPALPSLIPVLEPSVGIRRAWRQPVEACFSTFWRAAPGSGVSRVSVLHFLNHSTDIPSLLLYICETCTYYLFQENKSMRCSTACIDLLSMP
jgi:hypothetical protein